MEEEGHVRGEVQAKRVSPGVEIKLTGVETLSSRHDGVSLVDCASIDHISRLEAVISADPAQFGHILLQRQYSNRSSHVRTSDSTHQHD